MPEEKPIDLSTTALPAPGRTERAPRAVPALTLVSHPSPQRMGERLLLDAVAEGGSVALSRGTPDFRRPGGVLALPLADPFLSRKPLSLEPGPEGGVRVRVDPEGTEVRCAGERLLGVREFGLQALREGVPLVLAGRVVVLLHLALVPEEPGGQELGMVGRSEGLRRVREDISRVADLNVPVLIRGETGTGKELVARAIHQHGPRRAGPFVSVNLGALSKELVAAELFGAQRGAYTGSTRDREGYFRAARGGTLFLDEVGEAPPEVQVALLRVLETGEVTPVGAHAPVPVDVRLLTATDANLEERVRDGSFRAPLVHRLASYDIRMPPLRERREDIGLLFLHFARQELEATGELHRLSPADSRAEPWLPSLQVDARLAQELDASAAPLPAGSSPPPASPAPSRKPSSVGERELLEALRACAWDFQATAERLGISRASVYALIDRSPLLRTARDLSPEDITRCFHECQGDLDRMAQRLEVSRRALQRRVRELGLGES
jgi:two-component system, NtrC family, nitrogen regulation response regulator GlnG